MSSDFVSAIIPVRNEEKYIDICMQSLLTQDYPKDKLELILVDGMSSDNTCEIITSYAKKNPGLIYIYSNPGITATCAMNIGIQTAKGDYIIRFDAHSTYPPNYISMCIETIKATGADNVGGLVATVGLGFTGETFAKVLSSKFGVGDSGFRTGAKSGYTDTVPFGTYPRKTFEKYGAYNEHLARNEDNELNGRIIKGGGKIYLNAEIKINYYCRNTIQSIIQQSFANGKWNVITFKSCPWAMSFRHFVPMMFVVFTLLFPLLLFISKYFIIPYLSILSLYMVLNIVSSIKGANNVIQFLYMQFLFILLHTTYGIGSIAGILWMIGMKNHSPSKSSE